MPKSSYLPTQEDKLRDWIANFLDAATQYQTDLPLTTAELTALTTLQATFTNNLLNSKEAKTSWGMTVTAKDMARKSVVSDVQTLVRKIQATPTVTPDIKRALGINPHTNTPTHSAPVTPTALSVSGDINGANELKWKRNGNSSTTQFLVQALIGDAT